MYRVTMYDLKGRARPGPDLCSQTKTGRAHRVMDAVKVASYAPDKLNQRSIQPGAARQWAGGPMDPAPGWRWLWYPAFPCPGQNGSGFQPIR